MKRSRIITIACLMGISLLGIVFLQMNWIRHDLAIRQEKFTQQATEAIHKAVDKVETGESVHFITKGIEGMVDDSLTRFFKSAPLPPVSLIDKLDKAVVSKHQFDSLFKPGTIAFFTKGDSLPPTEEIRIINGKDNSGKKFSVTVQSVDGKTTKIAGAIDENEVELEERIKKQTEKIEQQSEMLARQAEKIKLRTKKLNKVFEKMAIEFSSRDFNLLQRVNPETVDSLIGIELKNNGINLPYSIELSTGTGDSLIWKRTASESGSEKARVVTARLFPDAIVNRNDLVKVSFPDTIRYFISSMWLMLLSSAVFTLAVIFTFAYTIYVIFRQKKLSEIKNDFINNMTHEFKTPITTIRIASEAIRNPDIAGDAEKIRYYGDIIRDESERMNSHVENILQIAQFDKNAFAPDPEPVDMNRMIRDVIDSLDLQIRNRGGEITFSDEATNAMVDADPRYMPLVITNLLDNAAKYCEKTPVIRIKSSNFKNDFVFSVCDNGIGMTRDMQRRIFEKFYRVSSGNIHNVKGFGLGLSYVKAIVTAHGGTILVTSEPGKGSCFEVRIPLQSKRKY